MKLSATLTAAGLAAATIGGAAFAGQRPYIANASYMGPDYPESVNADYSIPDFYTSPKYRQFLFTNNTPEVYGWEDFRPSNGYNAHEEKCVINGSDGEYETNTNFLVPHGNDGHFTWDIVLPMKPRGNLNIVVQCAVLKDNAPDIYNPVSGLWCAGEMGERLGFGLCTRAEDRPNRNPVQANWLPKITARAYPGPQNEFDPDGFYLTAYRNPGAYTARSDFRTLDGGDNARVVLKSCMDKTILVKIPVTGQTNQAGEVEEDLEAGDRIRVRMDIPNGHSMDIYCHEQSVRVMGMGDPATRIP